MHIFFERETMMASYQQRLSIKIFWIWSLYILIPLPFLSYHDECKIRLIDAEIFLSLSLFHLIDLEALHHLDCSQAESRFDNKDKMFLFVTKAKYNHDGRHDYISYLETRLPYHSQQTYLNIFGILQIRFYFCFHLCLHLLLYHDYSLIDEVRCFCFCCFCFCSSCCCYYVHVKWLSIRSLCGSYCDKIAKTIKYE